MQYHANLRHPKRLILSLKYDNVRDVWVEVAHSLTASQLVLGRGGGVYLLFTNHQAQSTTGKFRIEQKFELFSLPLYASFI